MKSKKHFNKQKTRVLVVAPFFWPLYKYKSDLFTISLAYYFCGEI